MWLKIEQWQDKPSKRRRNDRSPSPDDTRSEDEVSDSEQLVGMADTAENQPSSKSRDALSETAPDPGDSLLDEIALEFDCGDDSGPNVSEKLAEIVNKR